MRIAILGATSQIARDLVPRLVARGHGLALFARAPDRIGAWLQEAGCADACTVGPFSAFQASEPFDAVLNCVGVGDPARAAAMGAEILEVTRTYDELALAYLARHPQSRYVFLSSGAAYGSAFEQPADDDMAATVPLNRFTPENYYGLAKLYAECGHRARRELAVVDLRIFGYFSHTQDRKARFFLSDILRAIEHGEVLQVSPAPMVRDYVHPSDLHMLLEAVLAAPPQNIALDVYSREPVDKPTLLHAMRERFGLRWQFAGSPDTVNATGSKPQYYSRSRRAAQFGYSPAHSSLEAVLQEARLALEQTACGRTA